MPTTLPANASPAMRTFQVALRQLIAEFHAAEPRDDLETRAGFVADSTFVLMIEICDITADTAPNGFLGVAAMSDLGEMMERVAKRIAARRLEELLRKEMK